MISNRELPVSLPEICAPRENLTRIFNQCAKKQYMYVQAPSGYGKTISVLLWLKKIECVPIWLTLDEYDNMLSLFYRSLCRALLNAAPQDEFVSQILTNPSFGVSPVENTMEFLSVFSWQNHKYTLILDDLHTITNEEILKSLPYVLKRLPPSMNIILISRTALPDSMGILKEHDKTAFIGRKELAFTPDEIRKHYASYGRFISEKEAGEIYNYTDGWVIILNAMIINGRLDITNENHHLSFGEFFEKNLWNGFGEEIRDFLMKISVVDSFDLAFCELLTGNPNCAEILDMLIRGNINLSRSGTEYRFHNLFLEFLRSRLEKSLNETEQKNLYSIAAEYYLKANEFYKAADYGLYCDNPEISMQVMQAFFKSKSPSLEQFLELAYVFGIKKVPKEKFNKSPVLYMPNILTAFLRGETETTKQLFDMFYSSISAFIETNSQVENLVADVAVTRLLLDFRVKLADFPEFLNSLRIHIKAENKVPGQTAIVTVQMPMLHRSVRDFYEFTAVNGSNPKTPQTPKTNDMIRGLFSCLLSGECDYFYQSVEAGLLMEQNKLGEALNLAVDVYNAVVHNETTSNEIYFGVSIGLAEIYLLKSNKEQYQFILNKLYQFIEKNNAQYLLKNLAAYEERAKIWDCDQQAAEDWLNNYYVGELSFGEFYKIYQNFTTVRAYIVSGMTDKALAALEQMKKLCENLNRPLDTAETVVLICIIEWISGKRKEARARLLNLLISLQPYGFIRVVANEGKAVLPALAAVIKDLEYNADKKDQKNQKNKDLQRYIKEIYIAAYEQSKRFKGLTYKIKLKALKMSPQQTLVLELLSKGHNNAEIVQITGLSLNTIRSHTKITYKKLEVNNAFDAVVKAKQLNIIQ